MKFAGWYALLVGLLMLGQWGLFLAAGQVPQIHTAPLEISFHLVAELITAISLCLSGAALLSRRHWGIPLYLLAAGMLLYTVINSPGYFAQRGDWAFVGMFAGLLIFTVFSLFKMRRALTTLAVLLVAAFMLHVSPASVAAQTNTEMTPPATLVELEARIQNVLAEQNVPGMGVALVDRDGLLWEAGFGYADIAANIPADANTRFRVGSISKSFVAVAVLMLVEDGQISLDDEVRALVPEVPLANPWEETHPLQLVHLLEHTAGFDDLHFSELARQDPDISTLDGLLYYPASRTARWQPGRHYSYSNSGPVVAAYAVEKVTGQTFEDYAQAAIFTPLGMDTAGFFLTEQPGFPLSKSYLPDGVTEIPYSHIIMRPSGAASMTPGDMARFVQMLLRRGASDQGDILQPDSVTRMETTHSTLGAQAGLTNGYALGNFATAWNGYLWRGHDGGIDGFISSYGYMPDYGVGFAFTLNAPSGPAFSAIGDLIRGYLTRDFTPPNPPTGDLAAPLASYTGFYESITPRNENSRFIDILLGILRVTERDGALVAAPLLGEAQELIPVQEHGFRRTEDPALSIVFLADSETGERLVQGIFGNFHQVPAWQVWLRWSVGALALALMASALVFAVVWIPWQLIQRLRGTSQQPFGVALARSVRVLPLLAIFSLIGAVLVLTLPSDPLTALGTMSVTSVSFWLLTWLFALFAVGGLAQVLRIPPRESGRWAWGYALAVAAANMVVMIYLAAWGVIGWRTWV